MATSLLSATANATGTGTEITGDFTVLADGSFGGGTLELEMAATNTPADYKPIAQFIGPGRRAIRNEGTNYFRGVLKGAQPFMPTPSASLSYSQ